MRAEIEVETAISWKPARRTWFRCDTPEREGVDLVDEERAAVGGRGDAVPRRGYVQVVGRRLSFALRSDSARVTRSGQR